MIKKGEKTEVVSIRMLAKDMDKVRKWSKERTKRGVIYKPPSVLLRERLHYDINRKHIKHED